jgi:beta-alanine--pyruvate transaminase
MNERAASPEPSIAGLDLDALWLPFTHNRLFKREPRIVVEGTGMYYTTGDGRRILDGLSGLWCCNAGHRHPKIVEAVVQQLGRLDYSPPFQTMHDKGFELATALAALAPGDLDHVFFANSGSEAVDTALKIALAYHRARGEGGPQHRFIGRAKRLPRRGLRRHERWAASRSTTARPTASALLPGVDHLPLHRTTSVKHMAFVPRHADLWAKHLAE